MTTTTTELPKHLQQLSVDHPDNTNNTTADTNTTDSNLRRATKRVKMDGNSEYKVKKVNFNFERLAHRIKTPRPKCEVTNIVAVINFERKYPTCISTNETTKWIHIDPEILLKEPNVYREKGPALVHKRKISTALMYESGRLTILRPTSEEDSKNEAYAHAKFLQKLYGVHDTTVTNYQIVNVVAKASVPYELLLGQLAKEQREHCRFNPEEFPGIVYKMNDLNITLLIFSSGKIVISGGKSVASTQTAFARIVDILQKFKKPKKRKKIV